LGVLLDLRFELFDLLLERALFRLRSLEEFNRLQEFFFQPFELIVCIRHGLLILIADCRFSIEANPATSGKIPCGVPNIDNRQSPFENRQSAIDNS
jgi:hypothetical protein